MCSPKPTKRQGLASKVKSWFRRPIIFRIAAFALNILNLVLKIYDHFAG